VLKPANVTFEQAAAVPTSGVVALQAVRQHGNVKAGDRVLIVGASGGVGLFAVQIARSLGAEVSGVCSTSKMSLVQAAGADHVIDYTREDFAAGERRYAVILDIGGNAPLARLRRALTAAGTLVIVGGEGGGRWLGGLDRQLRAMLLSRFVGQKMGTYITKENHADLLVLKELIESGKVTPVIDRTYPLAAVPEAIRYLQEGHAQGKVIITV
jgi:NADPH:quinone reductase-like Zn-dependent oxidoreductase